MELKESDIRKLSELARVSLEGEETGLLDNMREIIGYFEVLNELKTEVVEPMSGGTSLVNRFRDDAAGWSYQGLGREGFSSEEGESLKTPPVFGESNA